MTNPQARANHRTTVQVAELCLQSAEDYHQQYLAKNPFGYCGAGGTGVTCPVGVVKASQPLGGVRADG